MSAIPSNTAGARPIVILGAGGHARVVVDSLLLRGLNVRGFVDPGSKPNGYRGLCYLGDDRWLDTIDPSSVSLANGIGQMPGKTARQRIFETCVAKGFSFVSVMHPSAVVAQDCEVHHGVQIMAGAVVQPLTTIGDNTIVNTSASIDHDGRIGANCHICPGAVLAGGVSVGNGSFVGLGAKVLQGVTIGENAVIAAGSIVRANVPPNFRG